MKDDILNLKEILKGSKKDNNGYRLAFKVERVAQSGLSRCITIYTQKGEYRIDITYLVSKILKGTYTKDGFLRIYGCGMDMLFETCYQLNYAVKNFENYKGKKKNNYNYIVSTYYDYF